MPRNIKNIIIGFLLIVIGGFSYLLVANQDSTSRPNIVFDPSTVVENCSDESRKAGVSKETCYSEQFQKIARGIESQEAFDLLFAVQTLDSDATGCHFIGHGIGYGTYERNPENWQEEFQTINSSCTYGGMHGILEMAIADLPEGLTAEVLPEICGTQPRGDCNHIIGHLTLLETEGDIPAALNFCDSLTKVRQREFCYTGVFMENITALNLINHGYVDQSYLNWTARVPDIKRLCARQTDELASQSCWKESTHALVAKYGTDSAAVFRECGEANLSSARNKCKTHAVGIMTARYNFNPQAAREICEVNNVTENFRKNCYVQIVASTLSTVAQKVPETVAYCANLPPTYQENCFAMIGNAMRTAPTTRAVQEACAEAPTSYRDLCASGAPINFSPERVHEEE